jgi:ABC-2 type transport system ATP-binding protein
MIELSKVTKRFKETTAVQNLTLKVGKGQIYGFIGPNGSGKTTTIKMVVGILQPTSGSIKVDGNSVPRDPEKTKSIIGYIPDDPFVWDNLTGREFLHFVGAMFGLSIETVEDRLKHYLKNFPVEELLDSYFGDYSRGTKQKLAIMAALMHKPKVLVIDEPIVGLDPASANSALELFERFAKDGGTVFLATHTLSAAQKICNKVGLLKGGRLISEGTLEELYKKAELSEKNLEQLYFKLVK